MDRVAPLVLAVALMSLIVAPCRAQPVPLVPVAVVASGNGGEGHVAAHAVDGGPSTRWSTGRLGEWLRIDLGVAKRLSAVEIERGAARRHLFAVEVSDTGQQWQPVLEHVHSSGAGCETETYTLGGIVGRFVKLIALGYDRGA